MKLVKMTFSKNMVHISMKTTDFDLVTFDSLQEYLMRSKSTDWFLYDGNIGL